MHPPVVRSLTAKILLESLVLLACLFGAVVTGGAYYQQAIVREMEAKSAEILKGIQIQVAAAEDAPLGDLLLELREEQEVDSIVLYDLDNRVAASAQSDRLAGTPMGAPGQGMQVGTIEGPAGALTAYVYTLPIVTGGRTVGSVKVALAVEPQTAVLRAFRSKMLWALIIAFCVTTALMCSSVVAALRPLKELSDHLEGVGAGKREPVRVSANSSEITVLQETFNDMVSALEEKDRMAHRLRQSQRLAAMGNLAAGVAHDVGNPLNAIRLTSSHLRDVLQQVDGAQAAEAQRYAAVIVTESARLDQMVQNFLTLARDRPADRQATTADALVADVLLLGGAHARRRDIDLTERLDAGDARVLLDTGHMKGALVNLLVNAFEAVGRGGRVEVRTSRDNGDVRIAVQDDGPGIAPEVRDRIFEPYFSTKPDGTGLGLALSRSVVEQHGGTLLVESQLGAGVTVTIALAVEPSSA